MPLSLFKGIQFGLPNNSIWLFGSIVVFAVLTIIAYMLTPPRRSKWKSKNSHYVREHYRQLNDEKKFMRIMAKQKRDSARVSGSVRFLREQRIPREYQKPRFNDSSRKSKFK